MDAHEPRRELRSSVAPRHTAAVIGIAQDAMIDPNGEEESGKEHKAMENAAGSQLPTLASRAAGSADAPSTAASTISTSTSRARMLQLEAEIKSLREQIQQLTSAATSRRTPAFDEMLQNMVDIREEMEELRRRQSFGVEPLPSYSRVG